MIDETCTQCDPFIKENIRLKKALEKCREQRRYWINEFYDGSESHVNNETACNEEEIEFILKGDDDK